MIGKRTLLNLGMLVLAGGLVAVLVLEPGRAPEAPPAKLTELDPKAIKQIRVDTPGIDGISLERTAAGWRMTRPYAVPANAIKIESLLELTATTSHARLPLPADHLDQFGLAPPKASLWLDDTELAFGTTEPIDHRRYLRVGDTIHLIDDRYYQHLRTTPEGYVSLELLPGAPALRAIHTPQWNLDRSDDGEWTPTPQQPGLSADTLLEKVDAWRRAQAIQVSKLADGGTQATRIELFPEGETEARVFMLRDAPDGPLLARPDLGLEYHLPESARARLLDTPTAAPEPASTPVDPTDA